MSRGFKSQLRCISKLLKAKQGRQLIMNEFDLLLYANAYTNQVDEKLKWKALEQAISWFEHNQACMNDAGFGTYYLCQGWTSSYPETTGYIIPTLLRYASKNNNQNVKNGARNALDWLLQIQHADGGWQGGYVHQNRPSVVFNTGQVIRGMIAGYNHFNDERYLKAAQHAADWLVGLQDSSGSFSKNVFLDVVRVYDSYVVAPVIELNLIEERPGYEAMARKQIDWIIENRQLENGWFHDCDNTIHKNDKPIIHTIAYTIDGILDCGLLLNEARYISAAERPALVLAKIFLQSGKLNGRYNKHWVGTEHFITTGGAQLAIIWHKLAKHGGNQTEFSEAMCKMNSRLVAMQQRHVPESLDTRGALFGSFPMWGRYESFATPNWATKYFADSLMNEAGYP